MIPAAGTSDFGRELNATDDRPHFTDAGSGLPVVEGKHITPFAVDAAERSISDSRACCGDACSIRDRTFGRARLAYRDVASPTNR